MPEKPTSVEIHCTACGRDAFLIRSPRYEGFTRTGDQLTCASCGHTYPDDASVPYKHRERVEIFRPEDRSADVQVFAQNEAGRLCRYCANYLKNPFTQWCTLNRKEVQATDSCGAFEKRLDPQPKPI